MTDLLGKGKVAVLKTSPNTIIEDYAQLMKLADFESAIPKDFQTGLKINISWQNTITALWHRFEKFYCTW